MRICVPDLFGALMVFRGHVTAKIDAKGRLKVPSAFFRPLDERYGREVFATSLRGDCAWIYPLEVWEQEERRLMRLPSSNTRRRDYLRRISYFGRQSRLDAQGRLMMASRLRERARLDGEVLLFGKTDHLEVWNLERIESEIEARPFTDEDLDELTRDLEALDGNGGRDG